MMLTQKDSFQEVKFWSGGRSILVGHREDRAPTITRQVEKKYGNRTKP